MCATRAGFPLLIGMVVAAGAQAQESHSDTLLTVAHYLDWEQVENPQIAPDGLQIVYTRRWVNKLEDKWESALWIMTGQGTRHRFLVKGSDAAWSRDGARIAYLADGEPKGAQIFVRWVDAEGTSSQITQLTAKPNSVRWSPDGKWLAFVMLDSQPDPWQISMPTPPDSARWTPGPKVIDRLHYRQDRRDFVKDGFMHLFVVPAEGGTPRQLTSGPWHVGYRFDGLEFGAAFDWTPDGRTIVFDGLRDPDAEFTYRESHLYAVDLASGEIRQLTAQRGLWTRPVVSPDGKTIAFTGHAWTNQTYKADELFVIGLDGGGMRQISGDLDRDPVNLRWAPDGSGVYFAALDRGTSNVYFAPLRGGRRQVTEGTHMLLLSSLAKDFTAVGTRADFDEPPDVVRFNLRKPKSIERLTNVNEDVLATKRVGSVEEVWYASGSGARIQGWIVKPPSFDASRKYPLILEIHGGPHAMYNVGFSYMFQNFAANGYLVLYTNPRGSTGYGTDFGNAINRAYPGVDYDDLMTGVDTLLGRGYVDAGRLYVAGCSGGGVLSSWVIGHTTRFAAAAVRCPVSNWMSMAGTTDIPLFTHNFFEAPFWEKPEPWLRQSPIMYVKNVKTPTLLMTGEADLRTPMAQTEEYYAALKLQKVPTTLLRFHGEYHGTSSKPSNFMRTQLYMMSWFQKYAAKDVQKVSQER